jgi:MFS family permease
LRRLLALPLFASLRYPDYRTLWLGNAFSGIAYWAMMVGRGWLVYQLSGSSFWVGLATFATMFPTVLVTPLGGVLADRFSRRDLALIAPTASCIVTLALACLALLDLIQPWHVVTLSVLSGVIRPLGMPSLQALMVNLVPTQSILNAVALSSLMRDGSRFLGPALASPLLALTGVNGVFLAASLLYALSFLQIWRVKAVSKGGAAREAGILSNLHEGVSYVREHPAVATIFLLVGFHCALTMAYDALLPLFAEDVLHAGEAVYGYLFMAIGGGGLLANLWLAGITGLPERGRLFLATMLFSGLALVALSRSPSLALALSMAVLLGVGTEMFMSLSQAFLQTVVPDGLRGRITGFYLMSAIGLMSWANLAWGYLGDRLGAPPIFLVTGLLFLLIALSAVAVRPDLRALIRSGVLAQPAFAPSSPR